MSIQSRFRTKVHIVIVSTLLFTASVPTAFAAQTKEGGAGHPSSGNAAMSSATNRVQSKASLSLDIPSAALFLPMTTYDTGGGGSPFPFGKNRIAIADVNGDGVPDVITANWCIVTNNCKSGSVSVLIGNGDGTFKPAVRYSSGGLYAFAVFVADLNGDGRPDLVVANGCATLLSLCPAESSVGILLGNGDGSFKPVQNYDAGGSISGIAVADLNGDGKPDVIASDCAPTATTCPGTEGAVAVLLNHGDGTLAPAVTYDAGGKETISITTADVNSDGHADVLVGNSVTGSVGVLLGRGDGTLRPALTFSAPSPYSIEVADLNGDGRLDLVTSTLSAGNNQASVLMGNGDGTFHTMAHYPLDAAYSGPTIVADVNKDGHPDLLTGSDYCENGVVLPYGCASILLGRGDGTFQDVVTYNSGAPVGGWITVADVDGDGNLDLIEVNGCASPSCSSSSVSVLLGNGDGTFQLPAIFNSGPDGIWVGVADLNVDGKPDLIVANPSLDFRVGVLLNNATHLDSTTTTLASSPNPSLLGQSVTFTANVSSSTGVPPNEEIVTFHNGSAVLGTGALSAGAASLTTSSLPLGKFKITASYGGDTTLAPSTSAVLHQVVSTTIKSTTATVLVSSLNPSIYGQKVTWTATVTTSGSITPTGSVHFVWSGHTVGAAPLNASGVAALSRSTLSASTYPLTAVYIGDANNLGSTSGVLSQVVTETTSAATLTSSPNPSASGQAVTFTATITSPTVTPAGPVTFAVGKTVLGTVQLNKGHAQFTTSTLAVGSTQVTATFSGDSNITSSSASVTQVVQ